MSSNGKERDTSPVRCKSSSSSYRPTLSQKAKRHVVTISDAMKTTRSTSATLETDGTDGAEKRSNVVVVSNKYTPSRAARLSGSSNDRAWSGGTLAAHSAHLVHTLDEECLSEAPDNIAQPQPQLSAPYLAKSVFELRRATPVLNGFDMLDHAITSLIHRLPESTLEDKFQLVSHWIDSYHVDVVPRKLATQLALLLGVSTERRNTPSKDVSQGGRQSPGRDSDEDDYEDEVRAEEPPAAAGQAKFGSFAIPATGKAMPPTVSTLQASVAHQVPTSVKTIISSAFALHQLLLVLVKLKPILGPVVNRTLDLVYGGLFAQGNPLATMPSELLDVTSSRETLMRTLRHFQLRTFFQEARDATRRLGAVQEFVGQFEKVRSRQMSSVKRQIESRSTVWVSACFRVWRGQVERSKEEQRLHVAHNTLQMERDRLLSKIRTLEDIIAARDKAIAELQDKNKLQAQRAEIAHAALRYDMIKLEEDFASSKATIDTAEHRIAELEALVASQKRDLVARESALQLQLSLVDDCMWFSETFKTATAAWHAVSAAVSSVSKTVSTPLDPDAQSQSFEVPLAPVTADNAYRWVRSLAIKSLERHRAEWDTTRADPTTLGVRQEESGSDAEDESAANDGRHTASSVGSSTTPVSKSPVPLAETSHRGSSIRVASSSPSPHSQIISPSAAPADDASALAAVDPLPFSALYACCSALLTFDEKRPALKVGHEALNAVALALLSLHEDTHADVISWKAVVVEILEQPFAIAKVMTLIRWCDALRLNLGIVLHEYLLMEENPACVTAVVLRLLQMSIAPSARFCTAKAPAAEVLERLKHPVTVEVPLESNGIVPSHDAQEEQGGMLTVSSQATETKVQSYTLNPLGPLLTRLVAVVRVAPVVQQCDKLLLSQVVPRISWQQMDAALRPLTIQESADRAPFTLSYRDIGGGGGGGGTSTPPPSSLSAGASVSSLDEKASSSIQQVIRMHFLFLRQAFLTYAGFESGTAVSATLSDYGLTKMMRDTRVGCPGLVDAAVVKSLAGDGLSAKRFAVALVNIAALRYVERSVPDGLVALINRMRATLFIHAVEPLLLAPLREHMPFSCILEDLRPDLLKVFRRYAVETNGNVRIGNLEVTKMLTELKINDDMSNTTDVQEALSQSGGASSGGSLNFDQFCVFLCVLGALRVRVPWMPVTSRVTRFLYDTIVGPLQKKLQLQSVSL